MAKVTFDMVINYSLYELYHKDLSIQASGILATAIKDLVIAKAVYERMEREKADER